RTLFQDRLTQALEASRRNSSMLSLTVFDIERFKAINDTFGQRTGDAVMRTIQGAADAARVLHDAADEVVGRPVEVEGREIRVTAKAGIALFPDDGAEADALFRNAEASLNRAKKTGERFLFYAPHINARVAEQVELESRLRRAVDQREIFFHFQPKVDMESKQIVGLEALMRW